MFGSSGNLTTLTTDTPISQAHANCLLFCDDKCPNFLGNYTNKYLNTPLKVLNHGMFVQLVLNVFLLFSTFTVNWLPDGVGFVTGCIAILLLLQTATVMAICNNRFSALPATNFMLGNALGLTVGGAVISFTMASLYRQLTMCGGTGGRYYHGMYGSSTGGNLLAFSPTPAPYPKGAASFLHHSPLTVSEMLYLQERCYAEVGSMNSLWWWAGLISFMNVIFAIIVAAGYPNLSIESIDASDFKYGTVDNIDVVGGTIPAGETYQTAPGGYGGTSMGNGPSFVGDYSDVPPVHATVGNV